MLRGAHLQLRGEMTARVNKYIEGVVPFASLKYDALLGRASMPQAVTWSYNPPRTEAYGLFSEVQ